MSVHVGEVGRPRKWRPSRAVAAPVALVVALGALAACSSDSPGPEAGVALEGLQDLEEQVGALEERVGVLEEELGVVERGVDPAASTGKPVKPFGGGSAAFFEDPGSLLGQEVTVSGEVSELVTIASGAPGTAFRIGGESSEPVPVLSANPGPALDRSDVVRVSGMVVQVNQDTFEEDFGVAADELFDDPAAFFAEFEGRFALAANRYEVLEETSE